MPLLKPSLQKQVRELLAPMTRPVRALVFTTDTDRHACEMCDDTRQLVEEIAYVSEGRITVSVYDLVRHADTARIYDVSMAPAVVIAAADGTDHGVRFFGIPSGYGVLA